MKKLMLLTAALTFVGAPMTFAGDHHKGDDHGKGMFAKHDTDGDGSVSKAEFLQHAEEKFSKMDANGDGSISKDEHMKTMKDMKEKWKEKRGKHKKAKDHADSE